MIGNAPLSKYTGVPGWIYPLEQDLLFNLAQQVPEKGTILEIGSEFGCSSSIFCKATHLSVEIFAIDIFPDDLLQKYQSNLTEAGYKDRTIALQGRSQDVAKSWGFAGIDLLFIDGDHSYLGVTQDIIDWTPKVRKGGVIVFHDYTSPVSIHINPILHPPVTRAIDDWYHGDGQTQFALERTVDTCVTFRKR